MKNLKLILIIILMLLINYSCSNSGNSSSNPTNGYYSFNAKLSALKPLNIKLKLYEDKTIKMTIDNGWQEWGGSWDYYHNGIKVETLRGDVLFLRDGYVYDGYDNEKAKHDGTPYTKITDTQTNANNQENKPQSNINKETTSLYNWILGNWSAYIDGMGIINLTIRDNNTINLKGLEGTYFINNDILYATFGDENVAMPLNRLDNVISVGNGYSFRKSDNNENRINNELVNSTPKEDIIEDNDEEITTRFVDKKTYFHSEPNEESVQKAYLVERDLVNILKKENGFAYVEYVNIEGATTKGWLKLSDLYIP